MAGADRISALPEETMVSILSLLPIADAVRTSVLSHSWRHLWTLLPGFHADLSPRSGPIRRPENVDRILSSLRGPIRHFSLNCSLLGSQPLYLQHFLDLIFQKEGLCILSLQCSGLLVRVQLPYFYSLENIDLSWIIISLPSDFCGFKQLTSLKLHRVDISQQDIQSLIDGSKKLTSIQLCIRHYKQPLSLTFNCPLLRYLRFNFRDEDVQGRIVSAPCIESTHVTACTVRYIPRLEDLVSVGAASLKFIADIAHVSHLSLNFCLLMIIVEFDCTNFLLCTTKNAISIKSTSF
ncbi:F-box protein-like protein [Rhynchospora pubera]|uniref:F-box protein-like protein n=1 Tax=Rhynchospora pubera TaxID=906938 RepID=A0AAV8C6J1_9POAL|nr:F-box protein-like protein [Rhynchospora pubera]